MRTPLFLKRAFPITFAVLGLQSESVAPHRYFRNGWDEWLAGDEAEKFPKYYDGIWLLERSLRPLSTKVGLPALVRAYRKQLVAESMFLDTLAEIHVAGRLSQRSINPRLHVPNGRGRNFDIQVGVANSILNTEVKRVEDRFPEVAPNALTKIISKALSDRGISRDCIIHLRRIPGLPEWPTIAEHVAQDASQAIERSSYSGEVRESDQGVPEPAIIPKDATMFQVFTTRRAVEFLEIGHRHKETPIVITLGPVSRRPVVDARHLDLSKTEPEEGIVDYKVPMSENIRSKIHLATSQFPDDGERVVVISSLFHLEPWHVRNAAFGDPALAAVRNGRGMRVNGAFAQPWGRSLTGVVWLGIRADRTKLTGAVREARIFMNPLRPVVTTGISRFIRAALR